MTLAAVIRRTPTFGCKDPTVERWHAPLQDDSYARLTTAKLNFRYIIEPYRHYYSHHQ